MKYKISAVLTVICLASLFAVPGARAGEINLSAAASLREALSEIADRFAAQHPGLTIRKNFGASGALAKQIEHGAPADIFISADQKWVSYLAEKELLDRGRAAILATNTLVFVGSDTTRARSLAEVAGLERVAVGSPKSVPAGDYAMQALHQAGLDQAMEKRVVMAKDVRECLMYAERGEVDGAFVYQTDALVAKNARILFAVPQELYAAITYPMGLTLAGAKNGDARQFMGYLQSAETQEVLKKYDFAMP